MNQNHICKPIETTSLSPKKMHNHGEKTPSVSEYLLNQVQDRNKHKIDGKRKSRECARMIMKMTYADESNTSDNTI